MFQSAYNGFRLKETPFNFPHLLTYNGEVAKLA